MHELYRTSTNRELKKKVAVEGGFRTEPDGYEEISYSVVLDESCIDSMARQAAGSKGQKSKAGPITVKVLARKRRA